MKRLLMWNEKPKPKKAQNNGKELVTLKEYFEMKKPTKKAD